MLNEAKELIVKAEELVTNINYSNKKLAKYLRHVVPPFHICFGVYESFRSVEKFAMILSMLFLFVTLLIPKNMLIGYSFLVQFCFLIPLVLVIFDIPSNYCFDSIKNDDLKYLKGSLRDMGINNLIKLEALEESVNFAKERVNSRIKKLNWIFVTSTAMVVFVFNFFNNFVTKAEDFNHNEYLNSLFGPFIIYLSIAGLILFLISAYKKANDGVFNRLHLTFLYYKKELKES